MRKRIIFPLCLLTILLAGAESFANVSSSAVLFLRIAAGARAAGMGEAFVAVADDATATHWNPAGLGTYPLSSKWFEINIPDEYRPLQKAILMKSDATETDYRRYDIWGLSPKGLVLFSDDHWVQGDKIEPRRDQSMESLLREYTGLVSDEDKPRIDSLMQVVGRINNALPPDTVTALKGRILGSVPPDYDALEEIEKAFIALEAAYNECMIDWERFHQLEDEYNRAFKDSAVSEDEADRILFSAEKSRMRFPPTEITVPFDVNFEGQILDIAADKKYLWLGTEKGLFRYDTQNRKWQRFSGASGLPAERISTIVTGRNAVYLATENGVVIYERGSFELQTEVKGLPSQPVQGLAVASDKSAWAVIGGEIYHYDGRFWKNYFVYRDVLNESPFTIYESMKLSGTKDEMVAYVEKQLMMNQPDSSGREEFKPLIPDNSAFPKVADSLGIIEAYRLAVQDAEQAALYSMQKQEITIDSAQAEVGRLVRIPYTAGFDFEITAMAVDADSALWIGTEFGAMRFDGRKWTRFGFREHKIEAPTTVIGLALEMVGGDSSRAVLLAENIRKVNKLEDEVLQPPLAVKIYANPAGSRINDITVSGKRVYLATESGAIFYQTNSGKWNRYNEENLGNMPVLAVENIDGEIWFATDEEAKYKGGARSELAMMHVNWLPELADDIYYEFFSYVSHVSGWGTVGGNLTFLSYGNISRTDDQGNLLGDFSAFDIAMTVSYGTPLTKSLSGGISAKVIYSHLSEQGAGQEKGSGTSTGLALDVGLLYRLNNRFNLGLAITNLGPDISYIDVEQSDPLPRNLAFGFAWKMLESKYNRFLITAEINKSLVGIDGPSQELKEVILNGGAEYWYGSFIAFRAGYIYDQEGDIKTPTLGFGLAYGSFKFDFAYIPSSDNVPLANTMRLSLGVNF